MFGRSGTPPPSRAPGCTVSRPRRSPGRGSVAAWSPTSVGCAWSWPSCRPGSGRRSGRATAPAGPTAPSAGGSRRSERSPRRSVPATRPSSSTSSATPWPGSSASPTSPASTLSGPPPATPTAAPAATTPPAPARLPDRACASAAEEAGGAVADGEGELGGLGVGELGAPGGADVEDVDHPVAARVDLRHADVEVQVAERGGDRVQQPEGVGGADLHHGGVLRLLGEHAHVGHHRRGRPVVAGLALQPRLDREPAGPGRLQVGAEPL